MKIWVFSILLVLSGCLSAEAPYHFMVGAKGEPYSGKAVVQGTNAYYVGDVVDGKPHGQGVMVQSNGDVTYGEWKSGAFAGVGAMISQSAVPSLMAGNVNGGSVNGEGIMIVAGDAYVGPFNALGLPHGKGVCTKGGVENKCTYNNGVKAE